MDEYSQTYHRLYYGEIAIVITLWHVEVVLPNRAMPLEHKATESGSFTLPISSTS